MANNQSEPAEGCVFFQKPSKNRNIRKRTISDNVDDDVDKSAAVLLSKNAKRPSQVDNKLHFSSASSKRPVSEPSDTIFHYESSKMIQVQNDSKATATLETETELSRDGKAIRERALKQAEEALKGKNKKNKSENLYKGINSYTDHRAGFRREQTVGGAHRPLRASAYINRSSRFDYQPDICKDYKETGYFGYGDSCKFLHDRGDYVSGWQL